MEKWEKPHPTALGLLTNSETTCGGETDVSRAESTISCSCEFVIVSRRFATIYTRVFAAGFCLPFLTRGYCCVLTFYHRRPKAVRTSSWKHRCPDSATPAASESCSETWPTSGWSDRPDTLPIVTTPVILAHLLQTGKVVSSDTVQLTQKSLERGHDFYFWGYVHDVKVCNSESKFYVESKCWE